jgi:GNAT superfamily N-acetyltransferase
VNDGTLQLRAATDADAEAARSVVFAVLGEYGLRPDPEGADRDLFDLAAHYGRAGGAFAVLVDGTETVVGTAGLKRVDSPDPEAALPTVELRKMYLLPAYRGQGWGRVLFEWALAEARRLGFRRMTLETATVLREAIRLYERNGFRRVAACPNAGRCDVVMEREL